MKIKGFDKDLKCRGYQFEVGKEYHTGAMDKDIRLCSNTVFHYCDSLQNVHGYYSCSGKNNRYCEIEVLGAEITDGCKCGSNHIRVIREITGEELALLRGQINGNAGLFNNGYYNSGNFNSGDYNSGNFNSGNRNSGNYNSGYFNSGDYNSGGYNSGDRNSGDRNSGNRNSGNFNSGNRNSGKFNSGYYNSGDFNSGDYNSGDYNSGDYNSGDGNSGLFNSCSYSNSVFCNEEDKNIRIFNIPSSMSLKEFYTSKYYRAIFSSVFILTEWISYTDEEKASDKNKELIGGYLKTYPYKEACANWWNRMSQDNKEIIKSIPNFNAKVFEDITGINVEEE